MRTTFPKARPRIIEYRDYKRFNINNFECHLKNSITNNGNQYARFEKVFLKVLDEHAPIKKKTVRANDKPYMTKTLRKAMMRRTFLKNKFYKNPNDETKASYRKQKNFTDRLLRKEKKNYYSNLDLKNLTDNKKFWHSIKPLFSDFTSTNKISLVQGNNIISDDKDVAETFNSFFINSVKSLDISENQMILTRNSHIVNPLRKVIKKFENHPSIIEIKRNVTVDEVFSFEKVGVYEMEKLVQGLNNKKAGVHLNIPVSILKKVKRVIVQPLVAIWNNEIVTGKNFPDQLKLADIIPIHKKYESFLPKNYRPVSVLPIVSKIFERLMHNQMNAYITKYLSPYLCGYRKGYNPQYALVTMIEKWKKALDKPGGIFTAILMDLSKAFDTINHELLIAKLEAYGFNDDALELLSDYLKNRWQRTKISITFSTWKEL